MASSHSRIDWDGSAGGSSASTQPSTTRVGEHGYVGGQEDMIIDIALQLAPEQTHGDLAVAGLR